MLASRSRCSVGYGERLVQLVDVVGLGAREPVLRMKTRQLDHAFEAPLADQPLAPAPGNR